MIKKTIQYLLMAVLFTPLLYTPFTLYPSYYGKTAIFQLIIGIAFLLYLILLAKGELKKPKLTPVFWLLLIYLGIRIITGFLGIDAGKSFWGTQGRMGGSFTWLHFFVFFFLVVQFFREKKDWFKLLKIAVFASFLVALTGVLQHFSISPFDWWPKGGRISGIIGNSLPFASYVLFSIWLTVLIIYDSLRSKNFKFLPIWILILITNVIVLFWSGTRGAIYIFSASIPFAIFLFGIFSKKRFIRLTFLLLTLTILTSFLFICLNLNNEEDFVKTNKTLVERALIEIARIPLSITSSTGQTRLLNWQIAYQGWTETPRSFLIGYGTENYDRIFDRYYNPEFLNYSFYETVGDRPHNILFEVVNASGILGLLAYLGIFIGVIWTLIISVRKNRVTKISAIILSLVFLTYLGQNLAGFDATSVLILFFLGLGLVVSAHVIPAKAGIYTERIIRSKWIPVSAGMTRDTIIYLLFIITCLGIYFGTIQPLKASYYTVKSQDFIYENQEKWGRYAKKALESSSVFRDENRIHIANSAFFLDAQGLFNISYENIESLKILHENLNKSVLEHPNTYAYKHRFAQVESMLGEYVNERYFNNAEKTFQQLDAENPNRQAVSLAWAQMRMIKGEMVGAIEVLQKVVNKNPNLDELRWYLGLVLLEAGEREKGILELEKSLKLGNYALGNYALENLSNMEFIIALWEEDGKYEKIATMLEIMSSRITPMRATWLARLAATYAEMGKIDKAIATIEEAVKLEPSLIEETREFIESLNYEN